MSYEFYAYRKLTNRYVPAYSYMDDQEYMDFTVKVVYGKLHESQEYDRYSHQVAYMTTSRPVSKEAMQAALHEFSAGCACEYDCCGHRHGGASRLKQVSRNGRRWTAVLAYASNY